MAKAKKGTKENQITITVGKLKEIADGMKARRQYVISEASIKDDFCNYSYEIIDGLGLGDSHAVKGSGLIKDDMRDAFAVFNVHLAVIDDVYKHADIEFPDIDKMHGEELTGLYHVTGFKIKGSKDNESIILMGTKYVSQAGGRIELKTPRIPLDNMSSYKWYNELKVASDKARLEVALYKEGKYIAVEVEEEEPNPNQTTIGFAIAGAEGDDMDDFNNAAL